MTGFGGLLSPRAPHLGGLPQCLLLWGNTWSRWRYCDTLISFLPQWLLAEAAIAGERLCVCV